MTALHHTFAQATVVRGKPRRKLRQRPQRATVSVTVRLSREEKDRLEVEAGERTLSAYIRSRVFGVKDRRGPDRRPSTDMAALARILAALGHSELAGSLRVLAMAASSGTLDGGTLTLRMLEVACENVAGMRRDLIAALGVKPE